MMENYNTKDIGAPEEKPAEQPKKVTMTAESRIKNRYHFAGDGKYQPMSVVASTIEEATAAWKEKRVPLEPAQPEAKVGEESKETINSNE